MNMHHINKKINIVHITTGFNIGGAERLLLDLCRSLDNNRFHCTVIATVHGGPLEAEFQRLGIQTVVLQKRTKLGLEILFPLVKLLRHMDPDIVHTHLFGGDTWGRIAAIIARVPTIISTEHNINKDEGITKQLVKKILSLFTNRIIAVSESVREYALHTDLLAPELMTVIYNGIDISRFPYREHVITADSVRASVIGRLAPQKGHRALLQAIPAIVARYPGFSLEIVGEGPTRASLEQQVRDLHIGAYVRFIGARVVDAEYYHSLDLVIMPSLWEGFGLVATEAQACGIPVLASNIPGLNEIVRDGSTGITFAPDSPDAISAALTRALSDPQSLVTYARVARKQVEERFTMERMVRTYAQLYEDFAHQ